MQVPHHLNIIKISLLNQANYDDLLKTPSVQCVSQGGSIGGE